MKLGFVERFTKLKLTEISKESKILIIILACFFLLFTATMRFDNLSDWDQGQHASSALFTKNLVVWWFSNPTISFNEIKEFAIDYHSHYKFFSIFSLYPPLDMMFSALIFLILGVSVFTTNLATVFESMVLLFFVFKLSKLYFKNKVYPFLCTILVGFNAIIFSISNQNYVDILLTAFIVSSVYFFIKFLRYEKKNDLYFFVISLALGIMSKHAMILMIPVFFVVLLWEKKINLIWKDPKIRLKALIIFLIVLMPLLIQLFVLYANGLLDSYISTWSWASSSRSKEIATGIDYILSWLPSYSIIEQGKLVGALSALFHQIYLVPFFFAGIYFGLKKKIGDKIAEKTMLLSIIFFLYFFVVRTAPTSFVRFLIYMIPFFVIISVYGIFASFEKWGSKRNLKRFFWSTILIFTAFSIFQTAFFDSVWITFDPNVKISKEMYEANRTYPTTADFSKTAEFLSEYITEPTTVITTYGHLQMFEFSRWDWNNNHYIYSMYMSAKYRFIPEAIKGNFSYRSTKELWEEFGIAYPKTKYIVIHEKQLNDPSFDYDINYFLSKPETFILLKTIDGIETEDRTFIFMINL
ncbi:MAG: glycosyltransferase family 39 protein [Nanoarchaeota archaeon]|nr:glycosyltransferase family 39 protein [Nanoarchaeota archaeon]